MKDIILMFLIGSVFGAITTIIMYQFKGIDAKFFMPAPPTIPALMGIVGIFVGSKIVLQMIVR